MVVVLIIGILAAIALPQYTNAVNKSRAVQLYLVAKDMRQAQDRYFLQHGIYSDSFDNFDIDIPGSNIACTDGASECRKDGRYLYRIWGPSSLVQATLLSNSNNDGSGANRIITLEFYPAGYTHEKNCVTDGPDKTQARKLCLSLGGKERSDAPGYFKL
ncbi:PilE-like protein [Elusimicrobium minutum Pei191]|uniref:PilE-like protein n=1 Tax=Elusimicrobium minutum (strain Pei191) TaxID=445932 RepID=B2KCG0_ELUMP|nr:PilE-like protein [Elusimicrobium minutum Pei191]